MKKLLFIKFIALMSFNALACPNLTGVYERCIPGNGSLDVPETLEITQTITNGIHSYKMDFRYTWDDNNVSESRVDGIPEIRRYDNYVSTSVLSCEEDALINNTKLLHLDRNITQDIKIKMKRTSNVLKVEMETEFQGQRNKDNYTCFL